MFYRGSKYCVRGGPAVSYINGTLLGPECTAAPAATHDYMVEAENFPAELEIEDSLHNFTQTPIAIAQSRMV